MKNDVYFMLKALLVLKIFTFFSWHFGYARKWLDKKAKETVLPNISRSKGNQAIKFGQLKENNVRIFFFQKSCRKWDRDTSSRSLFVILKSSMQDKSK